jgi:hypothetical protein
MTNSLPVESRQRIDAWRIPVPSRGPCEWSDPELKVVFERRADHPELSHPRFECAGCRRSVRYLVTPELRCRWCVGARHAANGGPARQNPHAWRAQRARRRLGVSEVIHSILPRFPARATRKRRLAQQIIEAENALLKQSHIRLQSLMRSAIGQGWPAAAGKGRTRNQAAAAGSRMASQKASRAGGETLLRQPRQRLSPNGSPNHVLRPAPEEQANRPIAPPACRKTRKSRSTGS